MLFRSTPRHTEVKDDNPGQSQMQEVAETGEGSRGWPFGPDQDTQEAAPSAGHVQVDEAGLGSNRSSDQPLLNQTPAPDSTLHPVVGRTALCT